MLGSAAQGPRKKVMKIGIDAHTLGSRSCGNETYTQQLLWHLASADGPGNQYIVYFTHPAGLSSIPRNHRFLAKRIRPANPFVRIPVSFPLEFQRERLDIFHCQFIVPPLCRCKTVVSIPDLAYEHHPQTFSTFEAFRSKILIRRSACRADHIITLSHYSKNDLVETYGISPEKITVTYLGVRPDWYYPRHPEQSRQAIAQKYGIRSPFVLYVGRIQARKNLVRLVNAYARLRSDGIEASLVLVGKNDWQSEEVRREVHRLKLEDQVIFPGYVPVEDLPVFYSAAEVFVFPSLFEGFGLPVLEAMACGAPTITSFGSSLQEVAGEGALLVDPFSTESIFDAIGSMLGDPNLLKEFRTRGLKRSSEFSVERVAPRVLEVYRKVQGTCS